MKYSCFSQSARTMNHRSENLGEHEKEGRRGEREGGGKMEMDTTKNRMGGRTDGWNVLPKVRWMIADVEALQSKSGGREHRQCCKVSAWHVEILILQFSGWFTHDPGLTVSELPADGNWELLPLCLTRHSLKHLMGLNFCMHDDTNSQSHGLPRFFFFFFHRLIIYWDFHTCIAQRQWQTVGGSRNVRG